MKKATNNLIPTLFKKTDNNRKKLGSQEERKGLVGLS
jgi:hypothetical protein